MGIESEKQPIIKRLPKKKVEEVFSGILRFRDSLSKTCRSKGLVESGPQGEVRKLHNRIILVR